MTDFLTADDAISPPEVLVFDVNETLLDIEVLSPLFGQVFGDPSVLRTWFGDLVLYSMTLTLSERYLDFFELGQAVLDMIAESRGVTVSTALRRRLAEEMSTLPAHPDVEPGLAQLRAAGYRLATLTNSPHRAHKPSPVDTAGLTDYFDGQFSVDAEKVFKPARQVYHHVADELGVPATSCMMVAAHMWDTIGAQSAGMRGALITRPGNAPLVAAGLPQPAFTAPTVLHLADLLAPRAG